MSHPQYRHADVHGCSTVWIASSESAEFQHWLGEAERVLQDWGVRNWQAWAASERWELAFLAGQSPSEASRVLSPAPHHRHPA